MNDSGGYKAIDGPKACYYATTDHFHFRESLPMFLIQLLCVIFINHVVAVLNIYANQGLVLLDTLGQLAVGYIMFLDGLDMDMNLILASGTKAISIAVAGTLIPMAVVLGSFFLVIGDSNDFTSKGYIYAAVALTSSNFHELTRIFTDLRIIHLDIGKVALCSSLLSDFVSWMLFLVSILVSSPSRYYEFISTVSFILVCILAVHPASRG